MANDAIGGIRRIRINGEVSRVQGNVRYNLGGKMREPKIGVDAVHGFTRTHTAAFLEFSMSDVGTLNVQSLRDLEDATVIAELDNGKTVLFASAWAAGDWDIQPVEGEIQARFEAKTGEEI